MSGDVQPRKRKDKKRRKDDINVDEPRGTAAALGEGDVFLHSQHDHGTGGHWCAKIIFFSLLAVLVTLIGLIILENRGLSELEANAVESRYSGVLDGWIDDAPDDHHDEHTLELKHHDDNNHDENNEEDTEVEIEKIEQEVSDEELKQEALSNEVPTSAEKNEEKNDGDEPNDEDDSVEDEDEFLEPEDIEAPIVEHITAPAGKPLPEIEDDVYVKTEKPINSLTEEEEYEKQQEELRREKEQASHMWLKVVVGGALLVATHAVVRRATATRDTDNVDEHLVREETPTLIGRRMTLLLEGEPSDEPDEDPPELTLPPIVDSEIEKKLAPVQRFSPIPSQVKVEKEPEIIPDAEVIETQDEDDKELYSDEDEVEEEDLIEDKIESPEINAPITTSNPEQTVLDYEEPAAEEEEDPEDVEIIDEEQLEEELLEEEEEISDVDDAELLSRLEAKYGRLPEPERPRPTKDGGNNVEDDWPGEPADSYWREQLDQAEQDLRQDWLD